MLPGGFPVAMSSGGLLSGAFLMLFGFLVVIYVPIHRGSIQVSRWLGSGLVMLYACRVYIMCWWFHSGCLLSVNHLGHIS